MKHPVRDFIIGLTAIGGLAGVVLLLYLVGELSMHASGRYTVFLHLDDASGITGASSVTLNGVEVGHLQNLRSADDPRAGVVLELVIDKDVRIPRDADVLLERGLVGIATLSLRTRPLEPGAADPGYLQPNETLRTSAINILDEIGSQISAALDEHIGDLGAAVESFRQMTDSLGSFAQSAATLVEPRSPAQVDAGSLPANLPSTLARLDASLASAQSLLDDDQFRGDIRHAVSRATEVIDQAAQAVDSWTAAAQTLTERTETVGEQATTALADFAQMTRSLTEIIDQVQTITTTINQGEGTLGMLVHNPDLYRSIDDAAKRLEKALVEAQLLVEKYRKEGIPIQF